MNQPMISWSHNQLIEHIKKLEAQLASAKEIFKELNDGCFCNFRYRTDVSQWLKENEA
jgi:hypothetical protein